MPQEIECLNCHFHWVPDTENVLPCPRCAAATRWPSEELNRFSVRLFDYSAIEDWVDWRNANPWYVRNVDYQSLSWGE